MQQHPHPADDGPADDPARDRHLCSCGHSRRAHEHYRRGSDCALCECRGFRRPRRWPRLRR